MSGGRVVPCVCGRSVPVQPVVKDGLQVMEQWRIATHMVAGRLCARVGTVVNVKRWEQGLAMRAGKDCGVSVGVVSP